MNSVALLLVVLLLLLLLGVMTAELVGPATSLDLDFDSDLDLDLDLDVDLKAGHQEQAPEVSSEIGREPRAADEDSDKDKDSDSTPANAEKAGAEAAEEFSKVEDGQGRRKLPTSCTTAGVVTCFASASNGDELELSAGTLSSTDGINSTVQLTLQSKYVSIVCEDGGVCVWQGATGKRVVYIYDNGGTSTLSHLVVKDGDGSYGGGLFVYNSNVVLILVAFIDNAASDYGGGAIYVTSSGSSSVTLHGCSFSGNTASYGPDVYNEDLTVAIGGCPEGKPIRPFVHSSIRPFVFPPSFKTTNPPLPPPSSSLPPSHPIPSRPVPSRPVPSRPVPSRPVPSRPVLSRSVPFRSVPSRPKARISRRSR